MYLALSKIILARIFNMNNIISCIQHTLLLLLHISSAFIVPLSIILFTSVNLPTDSHSLGVIKLLISEGASYPLIEFQSSLTEMATPATRHPTQGWADFYRCSNFK